MMRFYVASDEPIVAEQVRELLVSLGQACPTAHVQSLDRVWASLAKKAFGALPHEVPPARTESADRTTHRDPGAESEIVVVVLAPDPERALAAVRNNHSKTNARILLVGPTSDTKLVLRGLREGASEFLDQADLKAELLAALQRLEAVSHKGRIVTLLSASGGTGCSTVAVNLAAALAQAHAGCAFVDLNLEAGDSAALLDLKPEYSIAELCQNVHRLDSSLLDSCLVRHSSGVQLLAAPARAADTASVTPDAVSEVLSRVAQRFPFVVVDLGNSFRSEQTLLQRADSVLLVLRFDFTCLRNARAALDFLKEGGVSRERMRVVANRFGQPNEIAAGPADEALGIKVAHYVPDDAKTVNRANNSGMPMLLQSPSSKVSRAIAEIASSLATALTANP
jgi:pilus assembly protein CpaE